MSSFPINEQERLLSALYSINPSLTYPDWNKAGIAAIGAGLLIEDIIDWSRAGDNFKSEADVRSNFAGVTRDGEAGAGTLIFLAKQAGWSDDGSAPKCRSADPVKLSIVKPDKCVADADRFLADYCVDAQPDHGYIASKRGWTSGLYQVKADSDTMQAGESLAGWLVVPVSSIDGNLQSLQLIAPDKNASKSKLNLAGFSMAGGVFFVGCADPESAKTFYLCEGIGVAWSALRPYKPDAPVCAVVCFGSGNVAKVAATLRERYGTAELIVIADAGMEQKMEAVCKDVGGKLVVMPAGSDSNYDLNDYEADGGDVAELLAGAEAFERIAEPERQGITAPIGKLSEQQFIPDFLVVDFLECSSSYVMFGATGSFKSFLAIDLAASICTATAWHGHEIEKPSAVVYLAGEGTRATRKRFAGWSEYHGIEIGENDLLVLDGSFSLNRQLDANRLAIELEAYQEKTGKRIGAVFIDTFSSFSDGLNEDSNTDVAKALTALSEALCKRLGAAVVVIHHTGHSALERERGAYAFRANVDGSFRVERADGEMAATIINMKAKDSERHKPIKLAMELHEFSYRDHQGRPVSTLVVGEDVAGGISLTGATKLSDSDADVLDTITKLCAGGRSCKWGDVLGGLRRGKWAEWSKPKINSALSRARKKLLARGKIIAGADLTYSIPETVDRDTDEPAF